MDPTRRCIGRILGQRRRDVGNEMKAGSARGPGRVSIHPGEKVRRLSTTTFFVFYIRQRRISESSLGDSVKDPAPALAGDPLLFGRRSDGRWELVLPFPGPGGVDDQSAVEALFAGLDSRIEWTAPGAMNDVQASFRVCSRAHRPHHFVQIGNVDVL